MVDGVTPGGAEMSGEGGGAAPPPPQAPEWMGALPEELRGDATLSRFKSVEDLARGHIEAHKVAKSKLAVPGEGASDDDWGKLWGQLGLPETADGYGEFGLDPLAADADDAAKAARATMVKAYQDQLHAIGAPPRLAAKIVRADLDRLAAAEADYFARGESEIAALKTELGADYEPRKAAAQAAFKALGFDPRFADELDTKVGSATLMRGFMKAAELLGEHGRVDGDGDPSLGEGTANAEGQIKALNADAGFREKYNAGDTEAVAKMERLMAAARRQALTKSA